LVLAGSRRIHERGEDSRMLVMLVRNHLGVPLDADSEAHVGVVEGFDYTIGSRGSDFKDGTRVFHRLMVEGIDVDRIGPNDAVQWRARRHFDRMSKVVSHLAGTLLTMLDLLANLGWDVLPQGATFRDRHYLNSPADAQHRQVKFLPLSEGTYFERVAFVVNPIGGLMNRVVPVKRGRDVTTTTQE
jgi:hypothetical protein